MAAREVFVGAISSEAPMAGAAEVTVRGSLPAIAGALPSGQLAKKGVAIVTTEAALWGVS